MLVFCLIVFDFFKLDNIGFLFFFFLILWLSWFRVIIGIFNFSVSVLRFLLIVVIFVCLFLDGLFEFMLSNCK